MTKKTVKYQLDPASLPPLTAQQKAELAALSTMPDGQIDTSDIAPLTEDFWKNSTRNPFYQTRINAILRDAMLHQHEAGG